jgi:hypothetical protein
MSKLINGDNITGIKNKILYFSQCYFNHKRGSSFELKIKNINLKKNNYKEYLGTPGRRLSDMFWCSLNWKNISNELNNKINILDIGCGNGNYGLLYQSLLTSNFNSYTGLDIYKNKKFPNRFNHIIDMAENADKHINGHNLITSQSALEHIEHDFEALSKITNKLSKLKKPFLQIHLVPAASCLWLYFWHGWRQYSKKNLGTLSKSLQKENDIDFQVVPLGGFYSFIVHFLLITVPTLLFRFLNLNKKKDHMDEKSLTSYFTKKSISIEHRKAAQKNPLFWAILITNKKKILDAIT